MSNNSILILTYSFYWSNHLRWPIRDPGKCMHLALSSLTRQFTASQEDKSLVPRISGDCKATNEKALEAGYPRCLATLTLPTVTLPTVGTLANKIPIRSLSLSTAGERTQKQWPLPRKVGDAPQNEPNAVFGTRSLKACHDTLIINIYIMENPPLSTPASTNQQLCLFLPRRAEAAIARICGSF